MAHMKLSTTCLHCMAQSDSSANARAALVQSFSAASHAPFARRRESDMFFNSCFDMSTRSLHAAVRVVLRGAAKNFRQRRERGGPWLRPLPLA